jgi:hypothetical protein
MRTKWLPVVLAGAGIAGCASPEAVRQRGGGAGADPGNRPAGLVEMHGGSRQYWKTPIHIEGERMPIDPSEQARQLTLQSSRARGGR